MTATEIRRIARTSGLQHAEFCLDQAETQIGSLPKARAELWRLVDAAARANADSLHDANMTALDGDYARAIR